MIWNTKWIIDDFCMDIKLILDHKMNKKHYNMLCKLVLANVNPIKETEIR